MDLRAVLFVPALAGAAICVFVLLLYAADYYLTILESTASGGKDVDWQPGETLQNIWKPFYLAWLLCLWVGPAYVIGRSLSRSTGSPWLALAVPVAVAWGLYPISQLSSLCAVSPWIPLHPQVLARLAQRPAATLGFYLLTLPLFALAGLAFKWAFLTEGQWHLLFAGVSLLVLAVFLYARTLGRIAFSLMFTRVLLKRKKKKKQERTKREPTPDDFAEEPEAVAQPSEMPPIHTPEGEFAGYNLLAADEPPAPRKRVKAEVADEEVSPLKESPAAPKPKPPARKSGSRDPARHWTDDDEDATPYGMHAAESRAEERIPEEVVRPRAEEMALLDRRDAPKAPKAVWSAELFAFLWQPGTVSAMTTLCGLGLLACSAVRVARMFNPVAGGEGS